MASRLDDLIREHAERLDQLAEPVDLTDVISASRNDATNVGLEPTRTQPEGRHRWPIIAVTAAAVVSVVAGGLMVATRTDPAEEVPADQPTTVATTTATIAPHQDTGAFEGGPGVTYIVPDGWENSGYGVIKRDDPKIGVSLLGAGDQFYSSLCRTTSGIVATPVGPTVDDLVSAWANLPGVDATAARDVTIDGFNAKQIQFAVPEQPEDDCNSLHFRCSYSDLRLPPIRCDNLMPNDDSGAQESWVPALPNAQQKIWVLNIVGTRLMIMARAFPDTSQQDLAILDEIVASIEIGRR